MAARLSAQVMLRVSGFPSLSTAIKLCIAALNATHAIATLRRMCSTNRRFNRLEDGAKNFFRILLRRGWRRRQERIFN